MKLAESWTILYTTRVDYNNDPMKTISRKNRECTTAMYGHRYIMLSSRFFKSK